MKCNHCGAEVSENDKFCGDCGVKISPVPLQQKVSEETRHQHGSAEISNSHKRSAPGNVSPIVPLAVLIVMYSVLRSFFFVSWIQDDSLILGIVFSFAICSVFAICVGLYVRIRKVRLSKTVFHRVTMLFTFTLLAHVSSDIIMLLFFDPQIWLFDYITGYLTTGVLESIVISVLVTRIPRMGIQEKS